MVIIAMLMFIDEICFVLLSAKSFSLHKKPQCHIGICRRQAPLSKQPQLKGLTACVKFIWAFHRYRLGLKKTATNHYLNKCTSWSVALSKMSKTNVTKAIFNNCQQLPCKTGSISTAFQNTISFQVPLEHAYSRLETTTDAERKITHEEEAVHL